MEKILVISDIHGRDNWKKIIENNINYVDKIVFIGDYFDSFDILPIIQIHNFKEIVELKKQYPDKVVLLLGNHDYHYFGYTRRKYSGFNEIFRYDIYDILNINREFLQLCYLNNKRLFSHAGVSKFWLKLANIDYKDINNLEKNINDVFLNNPEWLDFAWLRPNNKAITTSCPNKYGDNIYQTPIWIRPNGLMSNDSVIPELTQIIGHTCYKKITTNYIKKYDSTFIFTDVYDTISDCIIMEDEKTFKIVNNVL